MDYTFDVQEFSIKELETVEAPLTEYQQGAIVGGILAVEVFAIAAVCAC